MVPLVHRRIAVCAVAGLHCAMPASPLTSAPPRRDARFWLSSLALFAAIGTLSFGYHWLGDLAEGRHGTIVARLVDEYSAAVAAWPLFAVMIGVAWRFPLDRVVWKRNLPLHVALAFVLSIVHTAMFLSLRLALCRALGLGRYGSGSPVLWFAREIPNFYVYYAAFMALFAAFRYYAALRDRELESAELERGLARAQLQNLRLQLQPHFLFNALNTISETMYDDPARADEMIGQLSELLRLSLRTTHAQEVPLRSELEVVGAYVSILRARFGERLDV
jgi:two-component system, LytTR family, sensor kinase